MNRGFLCTLRLTCRPDRLRGVHQVSAEMMQVVGGPGQDEICVVQRDGMCKGCVALMGIEHQWLLAWTTALALHALH